MSLNPTVNHTGQKSGGELFKNFQISMVSVVKICRQTSTGALPLQIPLGAFRPPDLLGYSPPNENSWCPSTDRRLSLAVMTELTEGRQVVRVISSLMT